MKTGRRFFLSGFAVTLAGAKALFAVPQRPGPPSRIPRFPDGSNSGTQPGDIPTPPAANPRAQLKENQKKLRQDADHLLELAKELKEQADQTEQADVLSLSLLKKAEEVEKLARQIKDLARAF
jgi:hypothetical protein